jgi:hypothetical protein
MSKIKIILISGLLMGSLLLTFLAIPNVKATGPIFETTGNSGFGVSPGAILIYKVTVAKHTYPISENPNKVGDLYRYTITDCNNSNIGGAIGDSIWSFLDYYNSTDGTWTAKAAGVKQWRWWYNGTHPSSGYSFHTHYVDFFWAIIPRNISAANYTIVTRAQTYATMLYGSCGALSSSTPPPYGNVGNGVFCVWNGSATGAQSNTWMWCYQYSDNGILQQMDIYKSECGVWSLDYQWVLEAAPPDMTALLLVWAWMPKESNLLIPIIVGIGAAIGIITILAFLENKGYLYHRLVKTKPY